MKKEEAILIAEQHIQELNSNLSREKNYVYFLDQELKEYQDYWYSDYNIKLIKKLPNSLQNQFGGAPGFIIEKGSKKKKPVSWSWISEIKKYEADYQAIDELLERGYKEASFTKKIIKILTLNNEEAFLLKKSIREIRVVKKEGSKIFIKKKLVSLLEEKYSEIKKLKAT
jgi:hypothetical protein